MFTSPGLIQGKSTHLHAKVRVNFMVRRLKSYFHPWGLIRGKTTHLHAKVRVNVMVKRLKSYFHPWGLI